ncbi:hypothetical protein EL22_03210 [Halostagnicola sp. A56]|uniref:DUF5807 family protein n=1 Tax=Halostagnicola sp. A56 TaxID=1495067 RepID=UPI00049F661D|nr:DUF5807 family protein [Halostagnicola sp. A56]KDE58649.1 hypothetical protein EL22_03210 [Halostagnicola sp. A56]
MSDPRAEFLAGERPDDVALFLADSYVEDDRLEQFGEPVEGGVLIVVDGESGRNAFKAATGTDAMAFAKSAMATESSIDDDLTDGVCPDAPDADEASDGDETDHGVQFVFSFSEEQNEDVGGLYAEGDVVHAYAKCNCGTAYSDRWTAEQ